MPFLHLDHRSRFNAAMEKAAPIILCWVAGITLGISYLAMSTVYFWGLLIFFLLVVVIFRNYRLGYYITLLLVPVDMTQLSVILPDISTYHVLYFPYYAPLIITLAAWLFSKLETREPRDRTTPVNGILLFMVTYMLVSLLWAPHFDLGSHLAVSLLLNFFLYLLSRDVIIDESTLKRAAAVWIFMGMITATGVIVSQWETYKWTDKLSRAITIVVNFGEITNRPSGFGSTNNMGGLLVTSIFLTIGMFMLSKKFAKKFILFLIGSYQLVAMIVTASRGSLIGFIGGLVLLISIHPSNQNKFVKYSFLSFFLLFVIILVAKPSYIDRILVGFGYSGELYFSDVQQSSISSTSSSSTDTTGLAYRKKIWKKAFKEMVNRPYKLVLGLGIGGFITYSEAIYTHSVPFSFFFDMGLAGALLFIFLALILFNNFRYYLKRAKHTEAYYLFWAAVVAFVAEVGVHGIIDYDFYSYTARMFWLPMAFSVAALNVMMSENPEL